MIKNKILEVKYQIQEKLSELTNGSLEQYKKILEENKKDLKQKMNLKFTYEK